MTGLVKVPQHLIDAAQLGNCVAFVGAGFSKPVGMPNWRELLRALLAYAEGLSALPGRSDLEVCRQCIEAGELIVAATELRAALHASEINRVINEQFHEIRLAQAPPSAQTVMRERMRTLVRGAWAGIVTTNYDSLIERALTEYGVKASIKYLTPDSYIGLALNRSSFDETFFVKIHGSVNVGSTVLTSEEYEEAYLKSAKIKNFLMAAMMVYTVVFIGSSVEDQILQIRQRLCADYVGGVPLAYALMAETPQNRRKAGWLLSQARVQTLFYPEGHHEALDELLAEFETIEQRRLRSHLPSIHHVSEIRAMDHRRDRLEAVGALNASIIALIESRGGIISKAQILGLDGSLALPTVLSRISRDEFFYRVAFLVSVGLLAEGRLSDVTIYEIEP